MFDESEVRGATLNYFNGDELATNVFMTKYCLRDKKGNFMEKTPADMHRRMAKEFARIEAQFETDHTGPVAGNTYAHRAGPHLSEDEIYSFLKDFKYIVPQGSPMMGIGNNHVNVSLSNCVVVDNPQDSVSSIMDAGKDLANLFKRRCGAGVDISNLLTHDKIALTLKLREISYGEEYKAVITCDSCEFDNHITFNVSKLDTVFFPEEFEHPIPVTLPTIKKDILLKLPRVADEDYLLSTESLGSNLWRFITEIDGHSDPIIISKVVEKLPLKDIHTIINTLGQAKYGIQTKVKFECQKCASFTITELPITSDFFTVS